MIQLLERQDLLIQWDNGDNPQKNGTSNKFTIIYLSVCGNLI